MCHPRAFGRHSRAMSRECESDGNSCGQTHSHSADRAIGKILDRQHGVVERGQLLTVPLSPDQIAYRLCIGRLHTIHPGVYAVGGRALARKGRLKAAALWAGPDAVVSHRSAAGLWSLLAPGEIVHLTTSQRRGPRPGLALHESTLPPDEITTLDGIPVTTAARTLLDIAATEGRRALDRALRQAEYLQLSDSTPHAALVARYPGGRGTAIARATLEAGRPPGHTESELEDRFAEFLAARGFEPPRLNASLEVHGRWFRVDCLWDAERVVVELDGRRAHEGFERSEADAERDTVLASAGYLVARVSWRRLHEEPAGLERDLRVLLASRRADAA